MLDLTIHAIDETLERDLRENALRNNRSLEEEAKLALRKGAKRVAFREPLARTPEEIEARKQLLLSYGQPDPRPFDLKAFSDALSDGSE